MDTQELLLSIQHDIAQIKKAVIAPTAPTASNKWIPRPEVMRFFSYGSTQMAALEQSGELIVAKVGKRKFVLQESIERLLEKNVLKVSEGNQDF